MIFDFDYLFNERLPLAFIVCMSIGQVDIWTYGQVNQWGTNETIGNHWTCVCHTL